MVDFKKGDRVKLIKVDRDDKEIGLSVGCQGVCISGGQTPDVKWKRELKWGLDIYCVTDDQLKLIRRPRKTKVVSKTTNNTKRLKRRCSWVWSIVCS